MTIDTLFLAMVGAAFAIFGVSLFCVSIYVRLGDRKPEVQKPSSTPARWVSDRKAA